MKKIFIILLLLNNLFANENSNSLFNEDNVKEIQLKIKINNNKLKITEYMDMTNIYFEEKTKLVYVYTLTKSMNEINKERIESFFCKIYCDLFFKNNSNNEKIIEFLFYEKGEKQFEFNINKKICNLNFNYIDIKD